MEPVISATKRRQQPSSDYTKCLICQSTEVSDKLSRLTEKGLGTFLKVMESQKDDVYSRLWPEVQDTSDFLAKNPMCHRSCRSQYTHK